MKKSFLLTLATIYMLSLRTQLQALADGTFDAQKLIRAAYHHMDEAAHRKDVKGALAYDAPNADRQRQLRVTEAFFQTAKSLRGTTTIEKLQVHGNQAFVVAKKHQECVIPVGSPRISLKKYIYDGTLQDTWLKVNSGWVRISERCISTKLSNVK